MPYKIFRQGEPPSQRDLQMLMDQSVVVCTSTTRPFAPHEGMLVYQIDTNGFMWYNGTTWVALGSAIDGWISGSDLSVPGNLSAIGTLTATGAATVASLAATGDVSARGSTVSRTVNGKVVSSALDTGAVSALTVIPGANAQNVPVIQDRTYRASGMISCLGTSAGARFSLQLWNGAAGGTKLGGDTNCRVTTTGNYQSYPFSFLWRAPATTTITNVNLSIVLISGSSGTVTGQTDGNYYMIIEELGLASIIGGL